MRLALAEVILNIDHIRCIKGGLPVVDDVTMTVLSGSITTIVGPSGAGKTTLLRTINLLDRPLEGALFVEGVLVEFDSTLKGTKPGGLRWLRQKIGMVFQDFALWPHMTVLENLIEAPVNLKRMSHQEAVHRAKVNCKKLGIEDKLTAYPDHLSGGQQQRVALIRALMMDPKVLLIDEGTSALDAEWTQGIGSFLQTLALNGMTIVVVTHDLAFARQVATQLIFMDKGQIVLQGAPKSLFSGQQVNKRWSQFLNEEYSNA